MSDYRLVSTLHAARVTLADARKAGDAAAVAAAEAQVAAARAAVAAALADGRVMSDKHLLDLDLDCLGAILSHLGPEDAFSASHTCTTLRSALFRGGLPGPLAGVCRKTWLEDTAATAAAALRALDGMEPALGTLRLTFAFRSFDEDCARLLTRALDAAPRAARIDITLPSFNIIQENQAGLLADVLSSPDRTFSTLPQVHVMLCMPYQPNVLLCLAGISVASIERQYVHDTATFIARFASSAANTLTKIYLNVPNTVNLTTLFPALRQLTLYAQDAAHFTTDMPSLTALAPLLKEIEFETIRCEITRLGFGFEPRRFARFVAAIQGVTRVCFGPYVLATLSQNENENLRQLTALHTLRDLEISCESTCVALVPPPSGPDPPRTPVADDAVTNLPPLPPGLTRLALSCSTRVAFGHPLPELRVLDCRYLSKADCASFYYEVDNGNDERPKLIKQALDVPLSIPSAALAPNLHTLLIGYVREEPWDKHEQPRCNFDLWTLVAARTALRVVVIDNARLLCSAPAGFDTTTAGFAALLARDAKDLVSVHAHECKIEGGHEPVVENFSCALKERGGRVCRAGVDECLFCMLHDGTDLWWRW